MASSHIKRELQCLCVIYIPAEIEQRTSGGGDAVTGPAQQVKLRQGSCFLRLDVLQIEAAHKEVLTPDVLRHQVHLNGTKRQTGKYRAETMAGQNSEKFRKQKFGTTIQ